MGYQSKFTGKQIDEYLDKIFNRKDVEEMVSFENEYIDIGNNNYQTVDKVINMLQDGKVISVNFHNDYRP